MGICGTGMASLAGMLKDKGYRITGSDQNVYPPMSLFLESLQIKVCNGYHGKNLHPEPDLVIVGNVITRKNPEAVALSSLGLPYLSFPQAIGHFALKDRQSIVVSGTHGKTTTSALIAWMLEKAGMDPGFMIGGIPGNFGKNYKTGSGPYFVIEGDEYDTAFFDKGPKFLHYRPWVTILTGIEFDHGDIYRDLEHVIESFRKLIGLIPADGLLIANGDDEIVRQESEGAACRTETYGYTGDNQWRAEHISVQEAFTRLTIATEREAVPFTTSLYGRHNISNLLSAVVLGRFLKIPWTTLEEAARTFRGVKRRQEIIGEQNGVLILDDFAHHPTAVRETLQAVRDKYSDRRLLAVFEPRSNTSRRNIFQDRYARSFDAADRVFIPEPPLMDGISVEERFSSRKLVSDLNSRGLEASYHETTDNLLRALIQQVRSGDVILIMSNGGFDNLNQRLLKALE
ncbi:MAG: UDP-N-acetylmuramate:L-alanyl-gamma-D-glutamyl-meso-diaminopimelate ligase [Deltaproteobacteria bacterium]|nr:UDP-N-acetylmuramate:L-alanyl-gamma-D-glutamyl-meso-diaminopimelate ligase [Deltaproteobacteria bacterium]